MPRRLVLTLVVLPTLACASLRTRVLGPSEGETRFSQAMAALERGDFSAARTDLAWLAGRCETGSRGRKAVLLLASAELDIRNPSRSTDEAARLARAYLEQPWVDEADVPVASSLYLLALDLGGAIADAPDTTATSSDALQQDAVPAERPVAVAARFEHCDGGGVPEWSIRLPDHSGPTTADRLAALADSLATARRTARARAGTIEELEAELERIRKLLKGGGPEPMRPR